MPLIRQIRCRIMARSGGERRWDGAYWFLLQFPGSTGCERGRDRGELSGRPGAVVCRGRGGESRRAVAVTTFGHNPTTGRLGQLNGVAGCIAEDGDGGCAQWRRGWGKPSL